MLLVERSPWDPEFNNSDVGVAWEDDRLPNVESKGWEEESSAPDRSAHPKKKVTKQLSSWMYFLNNYLPIYKYLLNLKITNNR